MQIAKVVAVLALFGALAIGIASAYIADSFKEVATVDEPTEVQRTVPTRKSGKMETLLGKWLGKWGHDLQDCTIEIDRLDGNNFYGTLEKNGAKIALAGTLDEQTGKVFMRETKILQLGTYDGWSLGEDRATLTGDGLTMRGTGVDKWGEYAWFASLVEPNHPVEK